MNNLFDANLNQSRKKFFLFARIKRVQHEWTKGSRDGECLWKQSNISEGLGSSAIKENI
jgi:hypothetical protein